MATTLGPENAKALLGLHAMMCCDTVGTFAGKGKISALKRMKGNPELRESLQRLEED